MVESETYVESYVLSSRKNMKQMLSEREKMVESKFHEELLRLKESESDVKTQRLSNVETINNQLRRDLKFARDELVQKQRRLIESEASLSDIRDRVQQENEMIVSKTNAELMEVRGRLKESEDDVKRLVLSNVEKSESQSESENTLRHDLKIARDEVVETRRRLEETISHEQSNRLFEAKMLEMRK